MRLEGTLLRPEWDVPAIALMTTREGGVSQGVYRSLNLSFSVGDDSDAVAENRRRVEAALGAPMARLHLVHGARVLKVDRESPAAPEPWPRADAAWTDQPGVACAVTAADCLPVLFSTPDGRAVAAAHAGWRGLAAGVLENAVAALSQGADCPPQDLRAWLGPCIGREAFEVGEDVLAAFGISPPSRPGHEGAPAGSLGEYRKAQPEGTPLSARVPGPCFDFRPRADGSARWRADLAGLARQRLSACGLSHLSDTGACTFSDESRFFSFRRDGVTGRMVAAIAVAWR